MKTRTKGTLYLRGKTWWLSYSTGRKDAAGKYERVFISTGEQDTAKARDWAVRHMAPVSLQDAAERAHAVAELVKTAEERALAAAQVAEDERNRLLLADVWLKYPYEWTSPKRGAKRRLSPRNVEENRLAWGRFVKWCGVAHPDIKYTDQVTDGIAREYSRHLIDVDKLTGGRHNKLILTAGVMFRLAGKPDPFAGVERHAVKHESRANLEVWELKKIISSASGELRRLFGIAIYTGMRLSDCVLLKWAIVQDGYVRKIGKERTIKTGKEQTLRVHPDLQKLLNEVPLAERGEYVCPDLARRYLGNKDEKTGRYDMSGHQLVSKMVRQHFETCGIVCVEDRDTGVQRKMTPAPWEEGGKAKEKPPKVERYGVSRRGFHSFRHSFITSCARNGVQIGVIRDWVGHSSEKTTEIYQHWKPDEGHQQILDALPTVLDTGELPPASSGNVKALQKELRSLIPKGTAEKLAAAIAALR